MFYHIVLLHVLYPGNVRKQDLIAFLLQANAIQRNSYDPSATLFSVHMLLDEPPAEDSEVPCLTLLPSVRHKGEYLPV